MNAIHLYRVASYCRSNNIPVIPKIIKFITFILFNSVIPAEAVIGDRSRFMYGGIGVVLHSRSKIGSYVAIGQGVTIGRKLTPSAPVIGDYVYISAGARILGDITIGNNVIIGANAVVLNDVPSNSVVAGVPAKVIKKIDKNIYEIMGDIL